MKHALFTAALLAAAYPLPTGATSAGEAFAAHARSSAISPHAQSAKHLLYAALSYGGVVEIYDQRGRNRQPIGELSQSLTFPYGVWVDTDRNVWVANEYTEVQSDILRFPPGSSTPDIHLNDLGWNVQGVWVNRHGDVYVINQGYSSNWAIAVYPKGQFAARDISDPNLAVVYCIVGDAAGNLFASGITGFNGEVDERPKGSRRWQNTGIAAAQPQGLAIDAAGNLVVSDYIPNLVETFPPGQNVPSNTFTCANCTSIALNHAGTTLWGLNYDFANGSVNEYTYPAGALIKSIALPNNSYPWSLATSPDLYP